MDNDYYIDPTHPVDNDYYIDPAHTATHIGLTCRNHPDLRWHTKNIAPIGLPQNILQSVSYTGHRMQLPALRFNPA